MKILLTGANGYVGARLLPRLAAEGHEIYALVRSLARTEKPKAFATQIHYIEADLLRPDTLVNIPNDIDAAYYLVHSMSYSDRFHDLEAEAARNFITRLGKTKAKQIIYLSGLANETTLSRHLMSRQQVGQILQQGEVPVTILMAGIIIGSGGASFEIIRDLVEKLPIMIAPKWLNHLVQPISIRDVLAYLIGVLNRPDCLGHSFEIGGPDVMSYKEALLRFAKVRGLKRTIWVVPVFSANLSSYWLYLITSTNYSLARYLVESMRNNVICKDRRIQTILPRTLLHYEEAIELAFTRIEEDWVPSSWKDSFSASRLDPNLSIYLQIPKFGILQNEQIAALQAPLQEVQKKIWSLGGENGWLVMNWAWKLRGFFDQLLGGIGLRRGRRSHEQLRTGDALDFWRVVLADETNHRLLLYAEMKLPGEAWLEFELLPQQNVLRQTASFRPHGLWGRCYWYFLYPFHSLLFRQLAQKIAE